MLMLLAQNTMSEEEVAALFGAMAVIGVIGCFVGIAIQALICYFLWKSFQSVPQEHRIMEPGMVWLLLIPLFNIVWNFFVYLRLSDSLKSYFDAKGEGAEVGDCGRTIGLWYCILAICSMIPYLGCLVAIAALVLLIMYLVKVNELSKRIQMG